MCLSTIYKNEKVEENILCRFVEKIQVDGDTLTFVDIMGAETKIVGRMLSANLTAGTVIVAAE